VNKRIGLNVLKLGGQPEVGGPVLREVSGKDIAVIGMAAKLPQAPDLTAFWESLAEGQELVGELPTGRQADIEAYLRFRGQPTGGLRFIKGAYLDALDRFDHAFFNISPKEASLMNPVQRLFLETAWAAFEDAGYAPRTLNGTRTGVYIGLVSDAESYKYREMIEAIDPGELPMSVGGNLVSITPGRISYLLNLKGPSLVVDTACSSSLVSLHLACQALRHGECDMALAGGARVMLSPVSDENQKIGIESSDERTLAFDDSADGSGVGEGVVALLLKPLHKALQDGDQVCAVIKGSATNQDGSSLGITAPNPEAQSEVLAAAWKDAGIDPETVGYIETHGTGTRVGDPIEVEGLRGAFRRFTDRQQFCAIGSAKTNLGHLYACAGLTGLVKVILALRHGQLPPHLHFGRPNRQIDFVDSPVFVNTQLKDWVSPSGPRRAGISSFGFSGTNCHVVLEEAPGAPARATADGLGTLVLSARNRSALQELVTRYRQRLDADLNLSLRDICYTAGVGREHHGVRLAIIASDAHDLRLKLAALDGADLNRVEQPWCWHGEHDTRTISQIRQAELADQVRKQMQQFSRTDRTDSGVLGQICALYTAGATVDWEELYRGEPVRKVSLPAYPFQGTRCWVDIPGTAPTVTRNEVQYFTRTWRQMELPPAGAPADAGGVLVVAQTAEAGARLAEPLLAPGRDVVVTADPGVDHVRLLGELSGRGITQIIHAVALEQQEPDLLSLYRLVRALATAWPAAEVDLLVVTSGADQVTEADAPVNPHHAAFRGMAQAIRKEFAAIRSRSVDVDERTASAAIADELCRGGQELLVAYRQGARYVAEFGVSPLAASEPAAVQIHADGAYVITGGLGGIGLELARYLVSQNNRAKIALVGRSGLPPRAEWAEWARRGVSDSKVARAVATIVELEALGAEISLYRADVTNAAQMLGVVTAIRRNCGRIAGVIHAAGIGKLTALTEQTEADFRLLMAPKVAGTCVLDELTRPDRPDFFVLCSSVAAVFPAPQQVAYAAANAFLDGYATVRNAEGLRTLSINWTTWKETGMAIEYGLNLDTMFKAMTTERAVQGFAGALSRPFGQVLVGELNLTPVGARLMKGAGVRLTAELDAELGKVLHSGAPQAARRTVVRSSQGAVKLVGKEQEAFTATERFVAEVCREKLGYQQIDVNENFFEMGADSIILTAIARRIAEQYPGVQVTHLFQHTTVAKLARYLVGVTELTGEGPRQQERPAGSGDIAIIGMGLKLPGAGTPEEFWANISGGVNSVAGFPEARRTDADRYLAFKGFALDQIDYLDGAYLEDISAFDHQFFRIPPREAAFMDPQQRLLLETAWHALEDAGYSGRKLAGTNTGVYFAFGPLVRDMYGKLIMDIDPGLMSHALVGNAASVAAGRVSYMLDLHGPSMVMDTACSSALVALDTACQAIRSGKCRAALVGSIKLITLPAVFGGEITGIGMDSVDGLTRTFDEHATGTAFGEGAEVILIKPLEQALADGDHIHAVVKGTAVNQDGASAGITAPNPEAQVDVMERAWADAGIDPETITYIEAHGSGTPLGDPIEISAMQTAFRKRTRRRHFCAVGALKTNLGHLAEGAGMAGLIKSVLALQHGEIPGNLNFQRPSSRIEMIDSPVYVNAKRRMWETGGAPRRCGVSAFGMSGTNAHVILEEYRAPSDLAAPAAGPQMLALSARTPAALSRLLSSYRELLAAGRPLRLGDLCYTANTGRGHYGCRLALVVESREQLRAEIERLAGLSVAELREAEGCYAEHKIVPEDKAVKDPGEVTDAQRNQATEEAAALTGRCAAGEAMTRELLAELGALYLKGAEVDWEELYAGSAHRKIRLPVYPFEATRCWIDIPDAPGKSLAATAGLGTPFCTIQWQSRPVPGAARERTGTAVLLEGGGSPLAQAVADQLRSRELNVVQVRTGPSFQRLGPDLFEIAEAEADYGRLFAELADRHVTLVVHAGLLSRSAAVRSLSDLEAQLSAGVSSGLHLTRALVASDIANPLDLYVIAPYAHAVTGTEEQVSAENGALVGLIKSVGLEYPQIRARAIDTDAGTTADQVVGELYAEHPLFAVAYRGGLRYVEQLTDLALEALPQRSAAVKAGGVYLITGGLGGVGSMVAKHLATQYGARLALVNRTPLPDRREWDALLAAGPDARLARRIATLKELEAAGAEVAYYAADVASAEQLAPVLADIRKRFGRIDGMIHAAGVAQPGMLLRKTEESFRQVLDPKVRGTWLLDQLTADDDLDFFALFSSGVTVMGEAGQADYVAANYYLDSFAGARNRRGRPTLAIDWVSWAEAGMSVEFGIDVDTMFKVLHPAKAIAAFEQALARDLSRVLVAEFNVDDPAELLAVGSFPCELSPRLQALVDDARLRSQAYGRSPDRTDLFVPLSTKRKLARAEASAPVALIGGTAGEYGDIEQQIAQIYSDTLGFREINIYDSFFELGGDSIMLSRMHVALEKVFPGKVKLVELFEYTSVSKLAQRIKAKLAPKQVAAAQQVDAQQVEADLANLIDLMQSGAISLDEALGNLHRKKH
jgi:polyketide synthase PksN